MVYKIFNKRFTRSSGFKSAIKHNEQLAEELHKPIIRKFRNFKYTHHSKAMFWVLIFQICN